MSDKTLKIASGLSSLILLVALLWKLQYVLGGMILSALFLGIIIIIGILLGCIVATLILKLILKKTSRLTIYFLTTAFCFLYFNYYLYSYSAALLITIPDNYAGQIDLVLSNVNDNYNVEVDTNGIGYISQWTFDHTNVRPQVFSTSGINLNDKCVGYNSSTFWANGKFCCVSGKFVQALNFEINTGKKKKYYSKDLTSLVDKKLVKLIESDDHIVIDTGYKK